MVIADEDQLLGVCWNVRAVGGPGLGPEVHNFAVRPVGPVDALCEFLGKGYYLINSIPERLIWHIYYEWRGGL